MADPVLEHAQHLTRRQFFGRMSTGIGTAALASMIGGNSASARRNSPAA